MNAEDILNKHLAELEAREQLERPAGARCAVAAGSGRCPGRCKDFDDDCPEVPNPTACYRWQPERGFCPFLSKDN